MKRPVLFLDIDGVVNRCGTSAQGLESDKVELLRQIVRAADPYIVVSSTWRKRQHQMDRLHLLFGNLGARFGGCTPILERKVGTLYIAQTRAKEIQHWLDRNPTWNFVILDDEADMGHLQSRLIRTESHVGLTPEIADRVIRALTGSPPQI